MPEAVVHGDFHHHDILAAERRPWLVVDPLPVRGDPAYDLVQYLLFRKGDLPDPVHVWRGVIERLSRLTGLDAERVKTWTFARLVSDAVAACEQGTPVPELEAVQNDLWSARLIHQLRA